MASAAEPKDDFESMKQGLESLYEKSPSTWPPKSDVEKVEEVRDEGLDKIAQVGNDLKEQLDAVNARMSDFADEEVAKVLQRYEEEKLALLEKQKQRLKEIREDSELISQVVESIENPKLDENSVSAKKFVLLCLMVLLGISAAGYFWSGISEENNIHMRYAAIDAVLAAGVAFYYDKSESK